MTDSTSNKWPSIPDYSFLDGGRRHSGTLFGLTELVIVLRRMWAYNIRMIPEPDFLNVRPKHAILRLSCRDLESLKPDDRLILDIIEQLGSKLFVDKEPSFETLLNHQLIGVLWNRPEMLLFQPRILLPTWRQNRGVRI
ncbi:hypothetical protein F5Y12DRAFT_416022 [Xylaria sp. FL1777]|nr:hypothetical protein F5Y12DRAFT_416022 [Xylaria sp. FL1777]